MPLACATSSVTLVGGDAPFDPRTSTRELTLACADYYGMVVLPTLVEALAERVPLARLRIVTARAARQRRRPRALLPRARRRELGARRSAGVDDDDAGHFAR
jgi:hypothetical protein